MAAKKTGATREKAKEPKKPKASNVIIVPKPSPSSYDPNRPLDRNSLLVNQVRHFQHLEKQWAEQHGHTCCDITQVRTEGEAAEYLRKMTELVHERSKPRTHRAGHE